jgi:putative phosphoesterase
MKIGLLSDTHSYLHPKVFEHFKECDEIWHAGDIGSEEVIDKLNAFKPTKAVHGNIDNHKIRSICPKEFTLQLSRRRCLDYAHRWLSLQIYTCYKRRTRQKLPETVYLRTLAHSKR